MVQSIVDVNVAAEIEDMLVADGVHGAICGIGVRAYSVDSPAGRQPPSVAQHGRQFGKNTEVDQVRARKGIIIEQQRREVREKIIEFVQLLFYVAGMSVPSPDR